LRHSFYTDVRLAHAGGRPYINLNAMRRIFGTLLVVMTAIVLTGGAGRRKLPMVDCRASSRCTIPAERVRWAPREIETLVRAIRAEGAGHGGGGGGWRRSSHSESRGASRRSALRPLALIKIESNFQANAVSDHGCRGDCCRSGRWRRLRWARTLPTVPRGLCDPRDETSRSALRYLQQARAAVHRPTRWLSPRTISDRRKVRRHIARGTPPVPPQLHGPCTGDVSGVRRRPRRDGRFPGGRIRGDSSGLAVHGRRILAHPRATRDTSPAMRAAVDRLRCWVAVLAASRTPVAANHPSRSSRLTAAIASRRSASRGRRTWPAGILRDAMLIKVPALVPAVEAVAERAVPFNPELLLSDPRPGPDGYWRESGHFRPRPSATTSRSDEDRSDDHHPGRRGDRRCVSPRSRP